MASIKPTLHYATRALIFGDDCDEPNRPVVRGTTTSVAWHLDKAKDATKTFKGEGKGHFYSRFSHPDAEALEKRMANLERGVAAVATCSGQAAQALVLRSLCEGGYNFIACRKGLFGGTYGQFKHLSKERNGKINIQVKYADDLKPESFAALIDSNTRAIYVESISNPNLFLAPIEELATVAHEKGIPLIVDNTCGMAGYIIRPIELGADIVVESTTKWARGQADTPGGMITDSGTFDWAADWEEHGEARKSRFEDDIAKYGSNGFAKYIRAEWLVNEGSFASPEGATKTLTALDTLSLRADRHCGNAFQLAAWLGNQDKVAWVSYLGLESHDDHQRAKTLHLTGYGGVVCFGLKDGYDVAGFIDNLSIAIHASHMGHTRTLVIHPDSTQNAGLDPKEKKAIDVRPDLLRVSVGLEHIEDLKADFEQALSHVERQPAHLKH